MRIALAGINALLVGLIVAGCSGDEVGDGAEASSKDRYTTKKMCTEFRGKVRNGSDNVLEVKTFVDDLDEKGLPEGAPKDVRDGLDTYVEVLAEVKSTEDYQDVVKDVSETDQASVRTFTGWVEEQCEGDATPSPTVPTDLGTDLPTQVPTDIPSVDPSALETMVESELDEVFPSGVPSDLQSLVPTS